MQTALVAGGAGFIGTHLCRSLLKDGYRVICIDNLISGNKKNLDGFLNDSDFRFIEQDITLPLTSLDTDEINYVFNLASPASPNKKSPRSYINFPIETLIANSMGTKNLLDFAKEKDAKFLFASSSEVYGDPAVSPQPEDYNGNVSPNGVRSVYDEGKRFGEAMTMAYFRKYGTAIRIARIFNTYGPKMLYDDGRVVSNFINQAIHNQPLTVYGDGLQTRSFCYVDDMIKGLKLMMFSDKTNGEVVNLGNPVEYTILELAKKVINMSKSSSAIVYEPLPQDDPKIRKPDISKAKKLLEWEPNVSIEEGLLKTIEYFRGL